MTEGIEIWKAVPINNLRQYYDVSDQGRVRSRWGAREGPLRILRPGVAKNFYPTVALYSGQGIKRSYCLHALVLLAFRGRPPAGMQGCHRDGDKMNNHLSNLRWDTRQENTRDSMRHGTFHHIDYDAQRGSLHSNAKLTEDEVSRMRAIYAKGGVTMEDVGAAFGISRPTAREAIRRITWKHVP